MIEEEDTQPYMGNVQRARGSDAYIAPPERSDDDEPTNVTWPPPGHLGFDDEVTPL